MAKKKAEYKLKQKRSGRWSVIGANGKYINGVDKAAILSKEGKIQNWNPPKQAEEEAPAEG